ncbi:MAG: sugar transferase [Bacteroidia bacterium]|nr:sugar transferase [Bacteroidia bacterium]
MKRLFDFCFALIALILLFPFFIFIGILIKFDSKGGVFYFQKRVGKKFMDFAIIKFRTMKVGADSHGLLTVGDKDGRITSVGYYLRKYKLDELPQFFNVLKGEMSIVGPRPEVKKYVDLYTEKQRNILSVRPGITDYASIEFSDESKILSQYSDAEAGYVQEILPRKLELGLKYVHSRNFIGDLKILLLTFQKIILRNISRNKIENFIFLLFIFSLPLYEKAASILAVSYVLLRISGKDFKEDIKISFENIFTKMLLTFFLIHVIGTFYSSNLSYAFFDLQVKLPFLIFPLLLTNRLGKLKMGKNIQAAFITGCTTAAALCLLFASISFSKSRNLFDFFYIDYSKFLHVTYFSIYLNLCILFLANDIIGNKFLSKKKITGNLLLIIFLFLTVILLSARTSLFTCLFTSVVFAVITSVRRNVFRTSFTIIIFLLSLFVIAEWYAVKTYDRMSQVTEVIHEVVEERKTSIPEAEKNYNSVSIRVELWQQSLELIKENILFGVGTGDIKDELLKKYEKINFKPGVEKKLNPHNQFLHTAVALGLTGLFILILTFVVPFYLSFIRRNILFIFFSLIIIMNCLTESILEVPKGVLFFCVFSILLFNTWDEIKNHNSLN